MMEIQHIIPKIDKLEFAIFPPWNYIGYYIGGDWWLLY
jgi:hypothetical protein